MNLSSFASFADFFLDGIFVDWFVQTKINNSLDNVKQTIRKIEDILSDLRENSSVLKDSIRKKEEEFKDILEKDI